MMDEQLEKSIKNNIKLRTYNGMHIMQLAICAVLIKFKNLKNAAYFCSSGKLSSAARDARYSSTEHN